MQETVLITGGTGLVGTHLTKLLLSKNYNVRHISRGDSVDNVVQSFRWNLYENSWDSKAIEDVDYIIHLAGANVAEGRWTKKRKQQILGSRINGSKLVAEMVKAANGKLKGVVSASATGLYGKSNQGSLATETDKPGNGFLANVCVQWEKEIEACNTKVAILRTGVVLAKEEGAVPKILAPIKSGVGAPLGSGNQLIPWIHINDLCEMYLFSIKNGLEGAYNAVAPEPATNKELTYQLAKGVNRKILLPNIPAFVLQLMLGEMSTMLLTGIGISPGKILKEGFEFGYPTLSEAVNHLL